MTHLSDIPGIPDGSLQLLKAVGISSAEELAAQNSDRLVAELQRANDILSSDQQAPDRATVIIWITAAMELSGHEPAPEAPHLESTPPINDGDSADLTEMLSQAPCAIPLPGTILIEKGLRVSDVLIGLPINSYSDTPDVHIDAPSKPKAQVPSRRPINYVEFAPKEPMRRDFDMASAKPISPSPNSNKRVPASKSGHEKDRVALIRAPSEETNRGKNPESRKFIRGVLHTSPWGLRLGAAFTLLLLINTPLAIISAFLLLAYREKPEKFVWVGEWILIFPIFLPITGLGYLLWGMTGKCRICTQKLFVHNRALNHIKAHHVLGIGYIVPLALHLLTFNWFRCSSCGTPVRLKK